MISFLSLLEETNARRGRQKEDAHFSPPLALSLLKSESRFDKKLIRASLWVPDGTPVSLPMRQPFINDAVSVEKETIKANKLSSTVSVYIQYNVCICISCSTVDSGFITYITAKSDSDYNKKCRWNKRKYLIILALITCANQILIKI